MNKLQIVMALGTCLLGQLNPSQGISKDLSHLKLPPGFNVDVLAEVPGARSMAFGAADTLFVSTQTAGKVYAVRKPFSGSPDLITLAEGLKMPNGIAFRGKALYVAEPQRVLRYPDIEQHLDAPSAPEVIVADLPYVKPNHAWKYIAFGPDDKLYVPIGAPCNVCDEPGFGVLLRMNADGSGREVFARGIRNTVGFAWHPETADLWFTDNGRDMLGDDVPPCELNRATQAGLDFGFPYCHGGAIPDPELGKLGRCENAIPPVRALGAHVAPLGMTFYTGRMFPREFRNQIFIAEHGSWNRSKAAGKSGHRVVLVRLREQQAVSYEPFLDGFLEGDEARGRPVDVRVAPDGALLVSDDKAGVIYRVSYRDRD
jgi:glucose/arabinose dehydrogenase